MPIKIINFDTGSGGGGSVYLNDGIYSSSSTADGSWRIIVVDTALSFQLKESGVWNEKSAIIP